MLPPPRPVMRLPCMVITRKADLTLFNRTFGSRSSSFPSQSTARTLADLAEIPRAAFSLSHRATASAAVPCLRVHARAPPPHYRSRAVPPRPRSQPRAPPHRRRAPMLTARATTAVAACPSLLPEHACLRSRAAIAEQPHAPET
jgi:hypothetical protein